MDSDIIEKQPEAVWPCYAVYILYILSFFSLGGAGIIGVIVAYVFSSEEHFNSTHRQYQIRQFWMSCLFMAIAFMTFFIGVGYFIAVATGIWSLVRSVVGLKQLAKNQPIENPKTWLF